MDARPGREAAATQPRTTMERTSVASSSSPARSRPGARGVRCVDPAGLLKRWWVPRSIRSPAVVRDGRTRVGHVPVRVPGRSHDTMAFFAGTSRSARPHGSTGPTRKQGDAVVTTVTFDEDQGRTRLVVHDLYPSKDALDGAIASGSTAGWSEMLDQLDELLLEVNAGSNRA